MNRDRRNAIKREIKNLNAAESEIQNAFSLVDSVLAAFENIRDEEQEALDNLPDSLQDSDKCERMEAALDKLEDAVSAIEEINSYLGDVESSFNECRDALDEAMN